MALRRIAITGAGGRLGRALVGDFSELGFEVNALMRPDFDIRSSKDLARLTAWKPQIVINSAAWTDVDGCARDPERAMEVNGEAAGAVAKAAANAGAMVVQVSTNEVFDGELDRAYTEKDTPNPINAYGASKLAGERLAAAANPRHLIVRTAWLFGGERPDFPSKIQDAAHAAAEGGRLLAVVSDEWGNPTYVPDLARAIRKAVEAAPAISCLHLCGMPATTRYDWARSILGPTAPLRPVSRDEYLRDSTPPRRAVLDTRLARSLGIGEMRWHSSLPATTGGELVE